MTPSQQSPQGNILIVDDSPDNLRVLSFTLMEHGYEVRCVKSGPMALLGIQSAPPDLVLLDIRMPLMDGYEICRRLKADATTGEIPIIFLSALDDVEDKVKAFEVGGVDFITKPFHAAEVLARVAHQLTIQRLRQQLITQNQRLEQEVQERQQTEVYLRQEIYRRILTESALQDAKEAAEAAGYAKNEFLSRMSHELRTPLNAILGFAQLLQSDGSHSPEHLEYLTSICRSGEHLLSLINNILTVTHLGASDLCVNESCFDFYLLLATLVKVWGAKAAAKGIDLRIERSRSLPRFIRSDESKLRRIITHLLDNAFKFTTHGNITLQLLTQQDLELNPEQTLVEASLSPAPTEPIPLPATSTPHTFFLIVRDTGCGIPACELEQLFEVFYQTDASPQTKTGLGLGLPISDKFARLLGGEITVSSTPGEATVITCRFQADAVSARDLPLSLQPTSNAANWDRLSLASLPEPSITPQLLQDTMPPDWILSLHQAALKGFDQPILHLLHDIPPQSSPLAQQLSLWTHQFQFDKILHLTQPLLR